MLIFLVPRHWCAVAFGMAKRVERLLVTSNFLTFAMVIALWIRSEANSRLEDHRFLDLETSLQQNAVFPDSDRFAGRNRNGTPWQPTALGEGLFPES